MARKLFLYDDPPYSISSLPSPPLHHRGPTNATSFSPPASSNSKKLLQQRNPPFDSSMALTVVVLLTALFFMGFFSIYIRRFAEDDPRTAHLSRRRRYRSDGPLHTFPLSSDSASSRKGLDPTTLQALPVFSYHGNNAKYQQVDCSICLTEFQERECVKTIPNCNHVFHVECVDTWLASHLSCPVCRETRLFEIKGGGELDTTQGRIPHGVSRSSTVDIGDACVMMGTASASRVRRTSSCSSLGQRSMLPRTLSF